MFRLTTLIIAVFPLLLAAEDRVSTSKPIAVGDIWVAATVMNDPNDDHRGVGRLLQFDENLEPKGVLWLDGTTHKVGGLKFGPDGTLWGFSQISWQVVEVGLDGQQKPMRHFANRAFSNVNFGKDGSIYFGEHLVGHKQQIPFNTTRFAYMPFTQKIGDGNIFKFSPDGRMLEEYEVESGQGLAEIFGATSTVLTSDGKRMIYNSETGPRVMQYDLENRRQLPDLRVFDPAKGEPAMVLFMVDMPDGTLLLGTGNKLLMLDPDTGETVNSVDMPSAGWAAVTPSIDAGYVLAGNFFSGELVKLRLADGEIVARADIGEKESLSGIAQFGGEHSAIAVQHLKDKNNPYREIIAKSEAAFMKREIDGAIENLDEDYVLYQVGEEGAEERMRGKAMVRQILGGFFEQNTSWVDSEVERLTLIENMLVQIEYDKFKTEAGVKTIPTLVVFEHRDGKRWREWRFSPTDR